MEVKEEISGRTGGTSKHLNIFGLRTVSPDRCLTFLIPDAPGAAE